MVVRGRGWVWMCFWLVDERRIACPALELRLQTVLNLARDVEMHDLSELNPNEITSNEY